MEENRIFFGVLLQNQPIFCNLQEMCKNNKPHSVEQLFRECIMNFVQI